MVEAYSGYAFCLHKVEYPGYLPDISLVHGKAEPHFYPLVHGVVDPIHGSGKGAVDTPECIVDLLESVQAHPDVGKAVIAQFHGGIFGDQGAVCRYHGPQILFDSMVDELRQVPAHERFAAGKQDHR